MLLWIEAVTDRSQNDVYLVLELLEKGWKNFADSEKREWSAGMKGSLNISDLTRIQNNIQLLSDVLELNLTVSDVPEIPTVTLFDEIRDFFLLVSLCNWNFKCFNHTQINILLTDTSPLR